MTTKLREPFQRDPSVEVEYVHEGPRRGLRNSLRAAVVGLVNQLNAESVVMPEMLELDLIELREALVVAGDRVIEGMDKR